MTNREDTLRCGIATGARTGSLQLLQAGVVELVILALFPWLVGTHDKLRHFDAGFSALFLFIYAIAGAVFGAALAVPIWKLSGKSGVTVLSTRIDWIRSTLSFLLLVAMEAMSRDWEYGKFNTRFITGRLIFLFVILLIILSFRLPRFRMFGRLPVALALYAGPLYVFREVLQGGGGERFYRLLLMLGVIALVILVGVAAENFWQRRFAGTPLPAAWRTQAAISVAAAVIVWGASAMLSPSVPWKPLASQTHPGDKPNVIFIVADTVRADHLSVYGYSRNTSPNLQKFADQAMTFVNVAGSGDWTLPTHASMFTGLYTNRHHARFDGEFPHPLSKRFETIAETLSRNGYATAAVVANAAVANSAMGMDQGFQYYDDRWNSYVLSWAATPYYSLRGLLQPFEYLLPSTVVAACRPGHKINAEAFPVIDKLAAKKRPFFLFLNFMDAHEPYPAPAPFSQLYGLKDQSRFSRKEFVELWEDVVFSRRQMTPAEKSQLVAEYDAGISSLDFQLGRLFDRLREKSLFDSALIIVTSDHGEALGERGQMEHGGMSVYDNQIGIPLLIKLPKSGGKTIVARVASQVDYFPTIMQVTGYPAPANIDGVSLLQPDDPQRVVFSESYPQPKLYDVDPRRYRVMRQAIFDGHTKFIQASDGGKEAYNTSDDPGELHDIAREGKPLVSQLEAQLRTWRRSAMEKAKAPADKLSREAIERLKSLGYVQGK